MLDLRGSGSRYRSAGTLDLTAESNLGQIRLWGYYWGYELVWFPKQSACCLTHSTFSIPPLGIELRLQSVPTDAEALSLAGAERPAPHRWPPPHPPKPHPVWAKGRRYPPRPALAQADID